MSDTSVPLPDEQLTKDENLRALDIALAQLSERQRHALFLRVSAQLAYSEIGQSLQISSEAARKLVARSELELRRILGSILLSGVLFVVL